MKLCYTKLLSDQLWSLVPNLSLLGRSGIRHTVHYYTQVNVISGETENLTQLLKDEFIVKRSLKYHFKHFVLDKLLKFGPMRMWKKGHSK